MNKEIEKILRLYNIEERIFGELLSDLEQGQEDKWISVELLEKYIIEELQNIYITFLNDEVGKVEKSYLQGKESILISIDEEFELGINENDKTNPPITKKRGGCNP